MPAPLDLTGRDFGRLTVLALAATPDRRWECLCACGATVALPANRLTSPRGVRACPACTGARARRPVPRTCSVCGAGFSGDANAATCSAGCRQARRRGLDAGVDHLPPPARRCVACGAEFRARNSLKTCSDACLEARRRARNRANFRRRAARDPDLARRMAQRRRERAAADPEYAARVAAWERARRDRHRARMADDPAYAARVRERARAFYAAHADAIQARRQLLLETMSDEALADVAERLRRYSRDWRRRRRLDPGLAARDSAVQREWRRRRAGGLLALGAARLLAAAAARLDAPVRIKACDECGRPVVGRRPSARSCSDTCAAAIHRRRVDAWREARRLLPADRACPICGAPVDPTTPRLTCSAACARRRRAIQKAASRSRR